jgi:hypothetical protein
MCTRAYRERFFERKISRWKNGFALAFLLLCKDLPNDLPYRALIAEFRNSANRIL